MEEHFLSLLSLSLIRVCKHPLFYGASCNVFTDPNNSPVILTGVMMYEKIFQVNT